MLAPSFDNIYRASACFMLSCVERYSILEWQNSCQAPENLSKSIARPDVILLIHLVVVIVVEARRFSMYRDACSANKIISNKET